MGTYLFPPADEMVKGADISPCERYRYRLWRHWCQGDATCVNFIMLNPSKADDEVDDPTIKRCIRFGNDWGFGGLWVTNLYAYRATKPKDLWAQPANDRYGPENFTAVIETAKRCDKVVLAWGAQKKAAHYGENTAALLVQQGVKPYVLAFTKTGRPQHPLFVPAVTRPIPWRP